MNKPRTAQVGAISKGQKQQKDFKVSKFLFYGTGKTQKLNRIGAPIPFCRESSKKIEGGALFEKKSLTMPKKLKGGTLWDFSTSVLSENSKKLKGGPFGENFFFEKKSHRAEKYSKGVPLGTGEFFRWCKKTLQTFAPLSRDFQKFMKIVRKVDHSEWDCQLKKKLLTVRVGLFSLREKAPTKNSHCYSRAFFP